MAILLSESRSMSERSNLYNSLPDELSMDKAVDRARYARHGEHWGLTEGRYVGPQLLRISDTNQMLNYVMIT